METRTMDWNSVTGVSTYFDSRKMVHEGIGVDVSKAKTIEEAFEIAKMGYGVRQDGFVMLKDARQTIDDVKFAMLTGQDTSSIIHRLEEMQIDGYKANYRDDTGRVLGIVTPKYKVIQNIEALNFLNHLLGGGEIICETAGTLFGGAVIWILAKMPTMMVAGEEVIPYIMICNSHNGKIAVCVCMTPVRVYCANTVNLALRTSKRKWTCAHMGDISGKLHEARHTLLSAKQYMAALDEEFGELKRIKMDEDKVWDYLKLLFPIDGNETAKKEDWMKNARLGVYNAWNAPDLIDREKSAFRFINAVSDFATHSEPMRKTKNYQENLMWKTANGNPLIDKAYDLVLAGR